MQERTDFSFSLNRPIGKRRGLREKKKKKLTPTETNKKGVSKDAFFSKTTNFYRV